LAIREEKPAMVVYLRADNDSSYGNVVAVMAALKRAGVDKLGMITETGGA
jgi:biopolymer transport protein TolR